LNEYHRRQIQIAEVLVRYELGHLLDVLGLEGLVSLEHRTLHRDDARQTRPVALRLAFEELGPTFVKLGQRLSTRADLLPHEYQVELAKLQDSAPAFPAEVLEDVVRHELQCAGTKAVFATFEFEPLAAASIGQAHAATLQDGTEVVVKVRRPGIVEEVEQDLEILQNLAARASQRWEAAARFDVKGVAEDFAKGLRSELDYLQEARNAERFATNFANDADVQIPRIFHELTTSRVITLERIRGLKITDTAALDAAGIDRRALAERATRVVGKSVLEDGFFHGDPHPGNFFVEMNGRLGIIDFGLVGVLEEELRAQLRRFLLALIRKDPDRLAAALLEIGKATGPVDRTRLREDLYELLTRYTGQGIADVAIGTVVTDVFELVRRYSLTLPHTLALLFEVLVVNEGTAKQLDPDFRFEDVLQPYAERSLAEEFSPGAIARRAERFGVDLAELAIDLPGQLHRVLDALSDTGGFEVHIRAAELDTLVHRIEHLGNRLAASVLAAAVIDGVSGIVVQNAHGHGWRRPMLAAGFGLVGSLGAYGAWRRSPVAARVQRLRSSVGERG
jgi:ubiquinone biosynthesis protein